jgi:glutamate-1-semialdehyde 2,1-aminomutase
MNRISQDPVVTLLQHNSRFIPGGMTSAARLIDPPIAFAKGSGAYLWDLQGNRYIDYHAGFAPHFLGHNFRPINDAVSAVLASGESLFGAGPTALEGRLAELICQRISAVDKVVLLTTGSEATSYAIRLSRAITQRSHIIVMQGGYNGNGDELACNVFNTVGEIGHRVSPGEYPVRPLGAGSKLGELALVHVINFNDLESIRYVCRRYPVAALITEPVLQNIGVVLPQNGYLAGVRELADELGFMLIFDEVKTGFRHALGGYSAICGVRPDLVVYGKAVANGFPLAVVGGRQGHMDFAIHPDPGRRPFLGGTYNGHPVGVAAAIGTIEYLAEHETVLYPQVEALGKRLETGMRESFARHGIEACVSRQGSALSFYFMEKLPRDFHDIAEQHDFTRDLALRRLLVAEGVFFVPIATKQLSISASHTQRDIDFTLEVFDRATAKLSRHDQAS